MRQIKKQMARGLYDPEQDNPFDLFISSTEIRWCYYKDSKNIFEEQEALFDFIVHAGDIAHNAKKEFCLN